MKLWKTLRLGCFTHPNTKQGKVFYDIWSEGQLEFIYSKYTVYIDKKDSNTWIVNKV